MILFLEITTREKSNKRCTWLMKSDTKLHKVPIKNSFFNIIKIINNLILIFRLQKNNLAKVST